MSETCTRPSPAPYPAQWCNPAQALQHAQPLCRTTVTVRQVQTPVDLQSSSSPPLDQTPRRYIQLPPATDPSSDPRSTTLFYTAASAQSPSQSVSPPPR